MSLIRRTNPVVRPAIAKMLNELEPAQIWRNLMEWEPFRDLNVVPYNRIEPIFVPAFDVKEVKDAYELRADLPGVKEADLEIRLAGLQLVITGKREVEIEAKEETIYIVERGFGTFTRTFMLPETVDLEHIVANLKDGVLFLHIPKKVEVMPKKIPLTVGTLPVH